MWRFLLGGLVTVCGVVMLFVASFGDPSAALRNVRAILPVVQTTSPPAVPSPPPGPDVAALQHQRDALQQQVQAMQAQAAQAAQEMAALRSQAGPAKAPPPGLDTAALQRQRDDLRQQLQALQATVAQDTQSIAMLRGQADAARKELEAARQQHGADQPAPDVTALQRQRDDLQQHLQAMQAKVAQETQSMASLRNDADAARHELDAARHELDVMRQQRAADQAAADQAKQAAQASQQRAADAAKQLASQQAALDRLKADAERARLRVAAVPDPKPAPPKLAASAAAPPPSGPDSPDAVLNRLRHAPGGADANNAAPMQQAPLPRQRLFDARTALAAGRIDEARALLEQAQVQLVFRPVGPTDDVPASGSVAAGQVAEALSMLGAGDIPRAIQYIDLAMTQASNASPGAASAVTAMVRSRGGAPEQLGYGYAPGDQAGQAPSRY